jgi:RNA polymerase sigma-70 factor (ECF subfamily)
VDDGEWAKLIVSGDEPARSRFVLVFHGPVYRWLRYLCACDDAAQELTQETFLEALQSMARYEGRASLSTWVHRVAYYRYTHWLREQRKERRWRAPLEEAEAHADPSGKSEWEALCLRQALAQLSEDHRDTFVLHYIQQLSVSEVAGVLSVPAGTVQSRLFHARRRLRELLHDSVDAAAPNEFPGQAGSAGSTSDKGNIHEVILR